MSKFVIPLLGFFSIFPHRYPFSTSHIYEPQRIFREFSSRNGIPVSTSKQLCKRSPEISWTPAIEKIRKKKFRMMTVWISRDMAEVREVRITRSFRDFETVFSGRRTRRDLILCKVSFDPSPVGSHEVITITKSRTFQLDLRYASFSKRNPYPIILSIISNV